MNRQQLLRDIKEHGNLRSVLALLKHDEQEVTRLLKNAQLDTFQRIQGRLGYIEELLNSLNNALR